MSNHFEDDDLEGYEEVSPGQWVKRGPDGKFEDVKVTSEKMKEVRAKGEQAKSTATELKITRILQSRGLDIDDEFLRSLADAIANKRSNSVQAAKYLDQIAGMAPTGESQSQQFEWIVPGEMVKISGEYYTNSHLLTGEGALVLLRAIRAANASANAGESPKNHD